MANYYTKEEIDSKGFLTVIPNEYVTESELIYKNYATKNDIVEIQNLLDKNYYSISEMTSRQFVTPQSTDFINSLPVIKGVGSDSAILNTEGNTATGNFAFVVGKNCTASGHNSFVEGAYCTGSGTSCHAEGYNTTASGSYAHSEGGHTQATYSYSHAEGFHSVSDGYASHAEGSKTTSIITTTMSLFMLR